MAPGFKNAIKWGCWIGIANLIWLYAAYYLGLHTTTMNAFYVFMLVWFVLNITAFVIALRRLRSQFGVAWGFRTGMCAGLMIVAVTAVFAAIAQIGYFKVVNLEWTEFLAEHAGIQAREMGLGEDDVKAAIEKKRGEVTLPNYAMQSALSSLVIGSVLSLVIMIFLRKPISRSEE